MNINVTAKSLKNLQSEILVITVFEDDEVFDFDLKDGLKERVEKLILSNEVSGINKEFTMFHTNDADIKRVLVMGLGKKASFTTEKLMAVSAIAARNARRIKVSELSFYNDFARISIDEKDSSRAIVEGVSLGLYKFNKYSTKNKSDYHAIKALSIIITDKAHVDKASDCVYKAEKLSESTNMVRDLVNEPANFLTPTMFAKLAEEIAVKFGINIKILNKEELVAEKMSALLAVNQGAEEPPCLVVMEYNGGEPNDKVLGLVGKGITFDSGGYSLKPSGHMFRMHCDMAGAAAVLGTMKSVAENKLKANVVAVMPLTENLIGSRAYKVGDVINTREGKTVEVLNTDAEGRLILADALSYIRSYKKIDYLIDIATLTGAIVRALGHFASGVMTNSQDLYKMLEAASYKSGEKIWQLPLFEEYKNQLLSDIADLENTGGVPAGSITAGTFLKEFVGDTPWAHIDIAGTAWMDESIMTYKKNPFLPKEGGTGVGTRTLYHLVEIIADMK